MKDEFCERIRTLRKKKGLSQAEFGEKFGISLPTVFRLEKGEGLPPRLDLVYAIANFFGCDVTWLITGKKHAAGIPVLTSLEPTGADEAAEQLHVPGLAAGGVAVRIQSDDATPTVRPGDIVVLSTGEIIHGDLVAFKAPWGETRVRRYAESGGERRLVAEIQGVPDIVVEGRVKVYGKISAIVRCISV